MSTTSSLVQEHSPFTIVSDQEVLGIVFEEVFKNFRTGGEDMSPQIITTGFSNIDSILNGFRLGTFNILASRVSGAKTTLAMNMIFNGFAKNPSICTLVFALESSARQSMKRYVSSQISIPSEILESGSFSVKKWEEFVKVLKNYGEIADGRVHFVDGMGNPALTISQLTDLCRDFKQQHKNL